MNNNREFTKLRRVLERKRYIKLKLCIGLNVLRLFCVGHIVQIRRSVLCLALMVFM